MFRKDRQYFQFCAYGFLKNLRLFEPFLILFLKNEGMTFTQIGVLYAIREIARNLFEIPGGIFADATGRKTSLLLAFSAYIISFLTFFSASSFLIFSLSFLLYAFGDAFRTGTHKAMIMSYLQLNNWSQFKIDYYGHTRSWSQIGSAVSAILAALTILFTGEYKIAFLISIIPYLLELINLALYPNYLNRPRGQKSEKRGLHLLSQTTKDFINSLKNKEVLRSILGLSIYSGYYKASKDYLQAMIQIFAISLPLFQSHLDIRREAILVGTVYFIMYLATSIASRRSGPWVRTQKSVHSAMSKSLLIGALCGIASGALIIAGQNLLAIIFFVGIYLFENLRKPIGIAQISDHLDQKVLASALSVESQAETVFAALFAVFIGFMVDHTSLGIALISVSALALIPGLLFIKRN